MKPDLRWSAQRTGKRHIFMALDGRPQRMPGQRGALHPARIVPHPGQRRQVAEAIFVRGAMLP
jgi:hypothetical protein